LLLAGFSIVVILLPLITVDISVTVSGAVRPEQERAELKLLTAAVIDSVFYREGDSVPRDSLIMQLYDVSVRAEEQLLRQELALRRQYIVDLERLTASLTKMGAGIERGNRDGAWVDTLRQRLESSVYREEAAGYVSRLKEQLVRLEHMEVELAADTLLERERLIAARDVRERSAEYERLRAALHAFVRTQLANWYEQLSRYRIEYAQYRLRWQQLAHNRRLYAIRAPVTGTLQGVMGRYPGAMVQAGEVIGTLSPAGELVGECYVPARDIGMIRKGQRVQFLIDALDYRYFGVLTGRVKFIDDDVMLQGQTSFFRVRSSFDSTRLFLRNGYSVGLKKGMSFRARFVVSRRSLWQLLFDRLEDWVNPLAAEGGAEEAVAGI
jgi:multidrug efflux pump subunit AcrA (membrane-fusion protein)